MRLPTYNKPRLISLAESNADYLLLPRGAEDELFNMLSSLNIKVEVEDIRNKGKAINASFVGTLREEQALAVREMLKYDTGVLSATTAFGKTVVASNIIAEHKTNTLVLVHTLSLLEQWKKSLSTFLSIESNIAQETKTKKRKRQSIIGQLGGGKNTCNGVIDIALMQSLIKDGEVKEIVQDYGQVIVDECHHVSSVSFEKILKSVTAQYVYGLTATPFRQDGHQPIIFLQCGNIRYRVDAKSEAVKRPFEHFLVPRLTSLRNTSLRDTYKISDIYTDLADNENRNKLIVKDILNLLEQGRNPIILTERVSHVTTLAQILDGKCENIILLSGAMTTKAKKEAHAKIEALPPQSQFVIIATGKYIGEGFDFPRLDTLLLAMPIAWKGKVAQYAGRLHRLYGGKKDVLIYDYIDIHIPVLERMYHKRMKGYTEIGYQVKCIGEEATQINNVF